MPSKVTGATNVNQIAEVFILLLAVRLVWQLDWQNSAENSHALRFEIQISSIRLKISGRWHISRLPAKSIRILNADADAECWISSTCSSNLFNFYFSTSSPPVNCFIWSYPICQPQKLFSQTRGSVRLCKINKT